MNASAEVREIGDPNKLLQALAAAFASRKDVLKEELKSEILEAASDTGPNAIQSSYDTQAAAVFAAEAKVRSPCSPNPPATRNPASVRSELLNLIEARRKLSALPKPQQTITFSPAYGKLQGLHSSEADAICSAFS